MRRVWPDQIDVQQTVFQSRALNLQPVGEDEAPDEAARGDAAMQEGLFALAGLVALAGDDQLTSLKRDRQLVWRKAGDSQADPNPRVGDLLDIIGRIALGGGLGGAVDQGARMVKAQQKGAVEQNGAGRRHLGPRKSDRPTASRERQDLRSQMKMGADGDGINRPCP